MLSVVKRPKLTHSDIVIYNKYVFESEDLKLVSPELLVVVMGTFPSPHTLELVPEPIYSHVKTIR